MKSKIIISGLLITLIMVSQTKGQVSGAMIKADIFFLDLGIVIEPTTGNEIYSRVVSPTSEEIKLRVKKVQSGSIYMATTKEMLNALQRIQQRMDLLENSFQNEMGPLRSENRHLRNLVVDFKKSQTVSNLKTPETASPDPQPIKLENTSKSVADQVKQKSLPISAPPSKVTSKIVNKDKKAVFNHSKYMSGVFAYQREDYSLALNKFSSLNLELANVATRANILYWMADSYNQKGDYYQAIAILDKLLSENNISNRSDDAIIQKGLLYRKTGQEELAISSFKTIVTEYPASEYKKLAIMELKKAEVYP